MVRIPGTEKLSQPKDDVVDKKDKGDGIKLALWISLKSLEGQPTGNSGKQEVFHFLTLQKKGHTEG